MASMAVSFRTLRRAAPIALVLSAWVVPAAGAPHGDMDEYGTLADRLARLEHGVAGLQRVAEAQTRSSRTSGTRSVAPAGASTDAVADLTVRVNELEVALRELTGRIEQLEFQLRQMDTRLQRLAAGSGQVSLGDAPPAYGSEPGAPANLAAQAPMPSGPPRHDPYGGESAPLARPQPQGAIPQLTGDESRDFTSARDLLLKGEFARAEQMFDAFVKAYPSSKLAGEGQFWKAESLYVRELYQDAAQAYLKVARDYPDSAKAPDSLVKLSLSFNQLGERPQACAALAQLDRRYPNAPERVRQNAQRIRQDLDCKA